VARAASPCDSSITGVLTPPSRQAGFSGGGGLSLIKGCEGTAAEDGRGRDVKKVETAAVGGDSVGAGKLGGLAVNGGVVAKGAMPAPGANVILKIIEGGRHGGGGDFAPRVLEADGVRRLKLLQGREYNGGGEAEEKRYGIGGIGFLDVSFDDDASVNVGVHVGCPQYSVTSVFAASFGNDFRDWLPRRRAVGENTVKTGLNIRPLHFFRSGGIRLEGGETVPAPVPAPGDLDGLAIGKPLGEAGEIIAEVGDSRGSHNERISIIKRGMSNDKNKPSIRTKTNQSAGRASQASMPLCALCVTSSSLFPAIQNNE